MHQINVNGLAVEVVRKDIKHLHLAVYPPHGRIRVAAPLRVNDDSVRLAVLTKLTWVKRQQAKFAEQERESAREYLSGESHYFQGARYLLNVVEQAGAPRVVLQNSNRIDLFVRPKSNHAHRERMMTAWYRAHLKQAIPPLLAKWEKIVGVQVAEWGIKQMKTKWGTCNIKARRIWLNLELAKKSPLCLEYVLVHELVHLHERLHNDRFTALMDQFLPKWRLLRAELNRAPLGHARWEC